MTSENKQKGRYRLAIWSATFVAIGFLFLQPNKALAQCSSPWFCNGADIYNMNTGNVGIGTPTPGTRLEVFGSYVSSKGSLYVRSNDYAYIAVDKANAGYQSGVMFNSAAATKWFFYNPGYSDDLRLYDTVGGDRITFQVGGNVGIGTTSPTKKLDVVGDIHASGRIDASGTSDTDAGVRLEKCVFGRQL
ncbi:MAG: hypothetical protein AABN34_19175 [Acidobacteriota bacterium]